MKGLEEKPKTGSKDHAVSAEIVDKIVQTTLSPPPPGRTRWTTRLQAGKFKLTSATVSKILRAHGLKHHLVRTYKPRSGDRRQSEGRRGPLLEPTRKRDRTQRGREDIAAYIKHWNAEPTPFIWTKPAAAIIQSRKRMLARISQAVH